MIIGFTGTQKGVKKPQLYALESELKLDHGDDGYSPKSSKFLHGGAVGADTVADALACVLEFKDIEVFPCHNERYTFWTEKGDGRVRSIHSVKPPLMRNRIIVKRSQKLFATPVGFNEELRSGTWATIRYMRELKKPIVIIFPDGSVKYENQ